MSKSIKHTTRRQGLRFAVSPCRAACTLWNCVRRGRSVHKALTGRAEERCAFASISNSYSISKWHTAAACSLCQRPHTTRTSLIPLCIREDNAASQQRKPPQRNPRRAFSDAVRIKDPMFTRTWSSETTATHNARNNRNCSSLFGAPAHLRRANDPPGPWSFMQMIQTYLGFMKAK